MIDYEDEPLRCPRCLNFLLDQEDVEQGIHTHCLGYNTESMPGIWMLCSTCHKPFFCDNGVFDDCGHYHEDKEV